VLEEGKEKIDENRLLLVDAGSLIYPAFHVMRELSTTSGFPTGAIFGFTRAILKLLKDYPSKYMAVAFDSRGETIRHKKFKAYKAQRPEMDEALARQIPKTKEILEALGVPAFAKEGYEADDLIATLAEFGRKQNLKILIVSSDKDLMQLVDEHVSILKPGRDPSKELGLLDGKGVSAYLGVPAEKVVDFLALVGDNVDNVPGVPGIGEKTARSLLEQFGSLEEILAHAEQIENKRVRESLLNYKENALLSKELVELTRVELKATLEQCQVKTPHKEKLREIFEELEFKSILKELGLAEEAPKKLTKIECHAVLNEAQFLKILARLKQADEVSLDLETTSQDPLKAEIVGIALAFAPYEGYYIPLAHDYLGAPKQLELDYVLKELKPLLEDKRVIGQNLKYDAKILKRYGIELKNISFDSMLAAYLLDPTSRKDLGEIAKKYLGQEMLSFKDLGQEQMNKVPLEKAAEYAAADAEVVPRLKEVLEKELIEKELYQLFSEVEMPLIPVLLNMELKGILLDKAILLEQGREIELALRDLQKELYVLAGEEFNPSSPKQVAHILFEKLKLPVIKKTKTGPSTDSLVLKELSGEHPLPLRIVEYRELEKLMNTYIKKLPDYINPETGRIHTSFNQSVTATGRLSSSDPNLQNIPVRTELGGQIRKAFVAPPGRKLLAADYSQIELRMLAHLSGDENLIETFKRDEDLHTKTAAEIFRVKREEVDFRMRDMAKRINFGIIYGISAHRVSKELLIEHKEAQKYIDSFFQLFPKVKDFIEKMIAFAEEHGYVTTILNRRRYLPDIKSKDYARRSYEQRNAMNAPIQGSAADLMKLAMIKIYEKIKSGELRADMLLQVHDELIFEVDNDIAEESGQIIKETMENIMKLRVPLKVDIKIGDNWGEI